MENKKIKMKKERRKGENGKMENKKERERKGEKKQEKMRKMEETLEQVHKHLFFTFSIDKHLEAIQKPGAQLIVREHSLRHGGVHFHNVLKDACKTEDFF